MIRNKVLVSYSLGVAGMILLVMAFMSTTSQRMKIEVTKNVPVNDDEIRLRAKGPLEANDTSLLAYIRRYYLKPPSRDKYKLSTDPKYKEASTSLTWMFIHERLQMLFENEPPGFFVEAGALDGEYLSNTLWLEKEKHWTGILVDPDPINYVALKKKNRKAWIGNICLSTFPYPGQSPFSFVAPTERQRNWITDGILWAIRGHTYNAIDGFIMEDGLYTDYVSSQCFPLESLLLAVNATVVDFLSLDIQGKEWDVLKLFPWDKIKIRALAVEYYHNNIARQVSQEFIDYFSEKGYILLGTSFEPDYFFVYANDKAWAEKNFTEFLTAK